MIAAGEVDTVVLAFTDMQGRLQGKRLHAAYFLDVALEHGTEGCNYLLAVDIDMNTVDGYAISSWEKGYGDMEFVPDYDTLRLLPHLPGTAMVQCDLVWLDHAPVLQSPRTVLKRQLDRAREGGWQALAGTELEFIAFDTPYEQAWHQRYRDLTPSNQYNVDYSLLGTSRVEPLLRDIRNHMYVAGLDVEGAKGECNFGQHEIGFLYADALVTADNHSVYKTSAKEIAAQHGKSITFLAKYNEREGSSCHIHLSLRGLDGSLVFWDGDERSALYDSFVAGVLATMARLHAARRAERQLLQAVRRRLLRADHDRLGQRQPHLRCPAGRPRPVGPDVGLVVVARGGRIRRDVDVVQPQLAVADQDVAVLELGAAVAQRLHLGPLEHHAGLELVEELEAIARLPVRRDVARRHLPLSALLGHGLRLLRRQTRVATSPAAVTQRTDRMWM